MTRKVLMLLAVFSASAVLGGAFPGTTATGAAAAPGAIGPREWKKLLLQPADGRHGDFRPAAVDRESLVTVMLEMAGEPVAKAQAAAADEGTVLSEDARAQLRSELRERQEPVRRGVEALGGQVVAETQDAFNGVKVRVPRAQLGAVGALPGVVAVLEVPTVERSAEESVPFLGVPKKVWQDLGLTGKDVSIGVVDTGIDYTHADFGGPGTAEAYRANDPRVVEPGTFPTAKVVGGWDFVGDGYNSAARPGDPALVRRPDGDPLDCNGHGTHVAGTAAGMGVLAGGSTYAGPYDASTYEHDFGVGPGVAPQASLYALKIFGCSGSSDAMVEAINWAVAHDLDVVNLSLGTPFGALGGAEVEALDNAARAGVVPVVSAGNEGDVTYIVGSPGTAERAISVAAVESVEGYPLADVTVGDATSRARNLNFGDLSEPVTGRLYAVEDDPSTRADESLGCVRSDYAKVPAGSVAVVNRGECALLVRAQLGQSAGAAAVVIVSNVAEAPPFIGGVEGATIPLLGVTPSHGSELRADAGRVATITANGMTPNLNYRGPAPFTSSGPALGGDLAKPDVAAPGFLIVSAGMGTGSGPSTLSGTSMAAPHVAGIAALVREARPSDSVETVKAAIVNTADPGGTTRYSTVRLGAGLVDPAEAVRTPVVALGDRGTASLSFGYAESVGRVSETKTVTLRNTGRQPVMFGASVEESSTPQGTATVTVSPRSVNVGAGREAKVRVTVTVTSSAGLPSSAFQAASGTILFTPRGAGANSLRVPYLLVHRAVSEVDTSPDAVRQPSRGTVDFRTRNGSPVAGSANVFAWGLSDPQGDDVVRGGRAPDIRAVGVQALPGEGMGVFAVNAYERLGTASAAEYDVLLDVDEDGSADFVVVGTDLGLVTAGAANGTFASVVFDLSSGSAVSAYLASGAISSSTVLLPFAFRDVGISEANPDFTYDAASYSVFAAGADEVKGPALFNVFSQPVQTGQYLELRGRSSASWTAALNRQQLQKTPVKGWMVVSLQNRAGPDQAELIELR